LGTRNVFEALLLAPGGRAAAGVEGATTWWPGGDSEDYGGLLRDIDEGYTKRLAIVVPLGTVWPLPAYVGGLRMQLEPPLSLLLKEALGAERAMSFDVSNACAGMMTGVFIVNDLIGQAAPASAWSSAASTSPSWVPTPHVRSARSRAISSPR
jgi:hypothetical protein